MTFNVDNYLNSNFESSPGSPMYQENRPASWGSAKNELYSAIKDSIKDFFIWQSLEALKENIQSRDEFQDNNQGEVEDLKEFIDNYAIENPSKPVGELDLDNPTTYREKIEIDAENSSVMTANMAVPIIDVLFSQLENRVNMDNYQLAEAIKTAIIQAPVLPNDGGLAFQRFITTQISGVTTSNSITIT